jgi:hypothetical protein
MANPSFPSIEEALTAPSSDADAPGEFTCGVDLGKSFDPTALAIIKKCHADSGKPIFECGFLTRLPLQMTYPAQIAHIGGLLARLRGPCEIVIDHTGVGKAVADLFQIAGMATVNVTITGGDAVTSQGLDFHVPKLSLVSRLQALFHTGQLKVYRSLPEAQVLIEELQSFQASVTDSGFWRFGARGSNKHDDMVLALAIAAWRAAGDSCFPGWGLFEYMRQTYGTDSVDRELTALPKPLEPIEPPEGPNFGHTFAPPAIPQASLVTLRAPAAVSSASGLSGRAYVPDRNGFFRMTPEDAKPLIDTAGWRRVEVEAATERWRPS